MQEITSQFYGLEFYVKTFRIKREGCAKYAEKGFTNHSLTHPTKEKIFDSYALGYVLNLSALPELLG